MPTCKDAIKEIFEDESGILSTNQVIERIYGLYPDKPWKKNTISHHLIGLSVNHPSSVHHPSIRKHAFLYSLGNGRYRKWNPNRDGNWSVSSDGVRLEDQGEDAIIAEDEADFEDVASGVSISLERDLELSLLSNLELLEPGLRLYEGREINGHQLDTNSVGRLDILAIDSLDNFVVIELKAGEADDKVCGQILRYMGWVNREIASKKHVRGLIIANSFHERVLYAVEAMPNVILKRYEVNFQFHDVGF